MLRTTLFGLLAATAMLPVQAARLADIDIYDRHTGQLLPVYSKDGRLYVPGEPNHEYEVRIRNRTARRILAVTSVDGVNVITGKTAHPGQSGYVLDRHGRVDIAGWRKSMDRIATFYFTSLPDSYAARTGRPDNVGVIGIALFREKRNWRCCWPWARSGADAEEDRAARSPAPAEAPEALGDSIEGSASRHDVPLAKHESRLGTGHGRSEHDSVTHTVFERASETPDETITLYYDSRRNLVAMGVIPVYARHRHPDPFPGGFVPDP